METRWIRRLGPGIAALGAVAVIASTTAGAPPPVWHPPACSGPPLVRAPGAGAWLRLDPTLIDGTYVGQRLSVGGGVREARQLELEAESFATGPSGGTVLVGSDDGRRSHLSLIDVADACAWPVGSATDVVRNGILSGDGRWIVESRVDRRTRADLGVFRRPLDGGAAVRLLPAIASDDRFGPTWLTDLAWSDERDTLVVASCGEVACRYRIVPDAGGVVTVADPGLGSLVGLAGDRLVVREASRGLPSAIVSVDVRTGGRRSLVDSAGRSVLANDADGHPVVVFEADPDGSVLQAIAPNGSAPETLAGPPPGLRLVADAAWAGAAAEHPTDRLLFGPDGRLPIDGSRRALLRDVVGGSTVPLDEVLR
jgi:hypothetical protein